MKQFSILFMLSLMLLSCDSTTQTKKSSEEAIVLPHPKEISTSGEILLLSGSSKIYSSNSELESIMQLFQTEVEKLTGVHLDISKEKTREADILFEIDPSMANTEYKIDVTKNIQVSAGSYQALTMAKTTLLQLTSLQDGQLGFPVVSLKDQPDANFRGLMIDLARSWHSLESVKKIIDLAAFYKTNYVHLHFTDYQSYTLPSEKYSKLSTPGRTYSFEELKEMEAYSQLRGVTIIPEVDIPGHSSPFVEKYPEIFAIKDVKENPYIINMGKEETYEALDYMIGEICDIFKSTPYYHIGGDEAYYYKVTDDPDVLAFMKKHDLGDDVHELYRYFLIRLNEIVKKHHKQMCVWEGFTQAGKLDIPKEIIVFEFETNRYLPNELIEDGYTVVNTSWKPLYVVNQKKWEPKTIYNWNMWRWENWFSKSPSFIPIQLEKTPLIIGAEMCAWEQAEKTEIPSLRKRLPALNERIWNLEKRISYEDFMKQMEKKDKQLSLLIDDDRQDDLLIGHNFSEEK